ncbi:MAG: hypothetical protein AAB074_14435 [Planctomycetota bacterium]
MKLRRCSPFVAVAFLAAHLAACACLRTSAGSRPASTSKPPEHSCCSKSSHDAPRPVEPVKSPCCCDDPSHFAVTDEPTVAVKSLLVDSPAVVLPVLLGAEIRRCAFDGSPPGRAPDVPLYTLHNSLLI